MKYLSFDIEATGLAEHDLIIEFGMVPFCTEAQSLKKELTKHFFIKCPAFEELSPKLDPWVREHNKTLIEKAHQEGISLEVFKSELISYLESDLYKNYFNMPEGKKVTLFGKSLNAIDLPFLNRDLGWEFMRKYFNHQVLDLSSFIMGQVDLGKLPENCSSGSGLINYLEMGEVAHTALEDAENTALMYLKLLKN